MCVRANTMWYCSILQYFIYHLALHEAINELHCTRYKRHEWIFHLHLICGIKKFLHLYLSPSESCYWNVNMCVVLYCAVHHLIRAKAIQDTQPNHTVQTSCGFVSQLLLILVSSLLCCCCWWYFFFIDHNGDEYMNSTHKPINTIHALAICSWEAFRLHCIACIEKNQRENASGWASDWAKYKAFYWLCNVPIKSCDGKKENIRMLNVFIKNTKCKEKFQEIWNEKKVYEINMKEAKRKKNVEKCSYSSDEMRAGRKNDTNVKAERTQTQQREKIQF